MGPKITSIRLTEADIADFDDIAERLKIDNRSDVVRLAKYALLERMGLVEEDTVDFQERVARTWGDDAILKFEITSVESQKVAVTIDGEPVPDMNAHVLYAMVAREGQKFTLPSDGSIIAKDTRTNTWYTIGRVQLERGAVVEVPLRRMPDLLQSRADDQRTPEERRTAARMNALLRQLSRESQGETGDE